MFFVAVHVTGGVPRILPITSTYPNDLNVMI